LRALLRASRSARRSIQFRPRTPTQPRLVFRVRNRERRLFEDAGGGSQDSRNRESGANPERSSPLCSEKTRFSTFVLWNRVFNFFPFANAFSENFRRFFASVRVAVIDALRRIGRRLNGKAPPFLTVDLQREPIFATLSKESNVPSFAVAIPR